MARLYRKKSSVKKGKSSGQTGNKTIAKKNYFTKASLAAYCGEVNSLATWGPTANFREMFPLRTWNFEVGVGTSMFDLLGRTSKFEVGVGTSMFDVTLSALFFFFHAKFRSQTSKFQLRTSKLEL